LTQPLTEPSTEAIASVIAEHEQFTLTLGPATPSPNQKMIWWEVNPKTEILALRDELHRTGLFHTHLPFIHGFIPHLTISEFERSPEEVAGLCGTQTTRYHHHVTHISWIVPDEDFIFHPRTAFPLS
jgi:hypothetical protein